MVPLTAHPTVELPLHVHIVTHPEEKRKSNTGVHAALLAPQHASLVAHDRPLPSSVSDSAVLFPSDDAQPIAELDTAKVRHLYIIDRCESLIASEG